MYRSTVCVSVLEVATLYSVVVDDEANIPELNARWKNKKKGLVAIIVTPLYNTMVWPQASSSDKLPNIISEKITSRFYI